MAQKIIAPNFSLQLSQIARIEAAVNIGTIFNIWIDAPQQETLPFYSSNSRDALKSTASSQARISIYSEGMVRGELKVLIIKIELLPPPRQFASSLRCCA
ncbi:MAG: hypothetical protein M0R33_13925 [Methylomonas sp.]|jgi:hypothetical protein|nr:hypothetical protein [Methylomonas sp.]